MYTSSNVTHGRPSLVCLHGSGICPGAVQGDQSVDGGVRETSPAVERGEEVGLRAASQ